MKLKKLNNNGSAIVSVIVVIAFITVLGTTLLYMAAQNYQQKLTDYQNKKSFYEAEKALDSLKAALISDVSESYSVAYVDTSNRFVTLGSGNSLNSVYEANIENRRTNFYMKFLEDFENTWVDRRDKCKTSEDGGTNSDEAALLLAIKAYLGTKNVDSEVVDCIYSVDGYEMVKTSGSSVDNEFIFKNVRSKKTVGDYTTFLCTDIVIVAPEYDKSFTQVGITGKTDTDKEIVSLTDCVVYMNWKRADYYDNVNNETSTEPETE